MPVAINYENCVNRIRNTRRNSKDEPKEEEGRHGDPFEITLLSRSVSVCNYVLEVISRGAAEQERPHFTAKEEEIK